MFVENLSMSLSRLMATSILSLFVILLAPYAIAADIHLHVLKNPSPALIDGKNAFFYELVINNNANTDVQLTELEIKGNTFGDLHFGETELRPRLAILGDVDLDTISDWNSLIGSARTLPPKAPGVIQARQSAIIFLQLSGEKDAVIPKVIHHQLKFTAQNVVTKMEYDVKIDGREPVVLMSPFHSGIWFPFNSTTDISAHRRSVLRFHGKHYIAQRFAIDWMRIGDDGRALLQGTSSKVNSNYYSYSTPIFAVADGVVKKVTDGITENIPDVIERAITINEQTVAGNSVVLEIGKNRYALYAHMQPGSLKVKPNEHVKRGQLIGLLGNSGNSTGPHLHFHVCDGPSVLECQGIPYVFEDFTHQEIQTSGTDIETLQFIGVGDIKKSHLEFIWTNQQIGFPIF